MSEPSIEQYKETLRKVHLKDRKRGFKAHLISYVCTNAVMVIINQLTNPDAHWSLFSIAGWGVGVVVHWATQIRSAEKQLKDMEAETESLLGKS